MKAIIEVGVNRGTDTRKLRKKYPKIKLFGFEPVPVMREKVQSMFKGDRNVEILPNAVSNVNKVMPFHITIDVEGIAAKHGSSSLYEFRDNLEEDWNRPDFKTGETIDVECITLEKFIEERGITSIEFLHCDAQGSDIHVLEGLGVHKNKVKAGVVEATKNIALYKDSPNTQSKVVSWLKENGFEITHIKDNDPHGAEVNIGFKRK